MTPPGVVTARRTLERVDTARNEQIPGSSDRLGDELGSLIGRDPARDPGVDPSLGHERDVGGRDGDESHRDIHVTVLDGDDLARPPEELEDLAGERVVDVRAAGVADDAATDLDRGIGHQPHHGRVGVGALELLERHAGEDRRDRLGAAAHLLGHLGKLVRLVAEDQQVGALRDLGVGGHRLAPGLGGEPLRRFRQRVAADDRHPPPPREGTPHVAAPDDADDHDGEYREKGPLATTVEASAARRPPPRPRPRRSRGSPRRRSSARPEPGRVP